MPFCFIFTHISGVTMVTEKGPGSANLQMCCVFPGSVSRSPHHRRNWFPGKAVFSLRWIWGACYVLPHALGSPAQSPRARGHRFSRCRADAGGQRREPARAEVLLSPRPPIHLFFTHNCLVSTVKWDHLLHNLSGEGCLRLTLVVSKRNRPEKGCFTQPGATMQLDQQTWTSLCGFLSFFPFLWWQ